MTRSFSAQVHSKIIQNCIEKKLKRFEEANLTLKPNKCSFGMTQTVYLGHVIDSFDISPDPNKIRQIKERADPKNVTDIRSFLGLANYYRKCVQFFKQKSQQGFSNR
jgi:hypothetical protein